MLSHELKVGQRVQTHPATDAWMRGDRFGTVVRVLRRSAKAAGSARAVVKMDRSGRSLKVAAFNLTLED